MASRLISRLCAGGTALVALSLPLLTMARPASAQEIERLLAGVKLGSRGTAVLAKYGNPNSVVIGDIGIRQPPGSGNGQAGAGQGGQGSEGSSGSLPGMGNGGTGFSKPHPGGAAGAMGGGGATASSGSGSSGFPGAPVGGFGGGGGFSGQGSEGGGGFGDPRSGSGSGGGASGPFGQTVSPLANEQEVTWVYNRKVGNNVVSYEFLIGPSGDVSQIRVSGYTGGNSKTKRGIVLGSTYKDVVRTYGYPEDHQQVGTILIASYKQRAHVSFQFLNQSGQTNVYSPGNKVIAITIATVE